MNAPQTPVIMEKSKWEQSKDYQFHEIKNSPLEQCISDQTSPSQFIALQDQKTEISKVVDPPIELQGVNQDEGLDLNKTPQQKPRRKKHRPKVIKEGKIAKTLKKVSSQSTEKMTGKRKYVRKNKEDCPEKTFGEKNDVEAITRKRKYVRKNKEDSPKRIYDGQVVVEGTPGKRKYIRKKKDDSQQHSPENKVIGNFCTNKSVKRSLNFDLDNARENVSNSQSTEFSKDVENVITSDTPLVMHCSTNKIVNESVGTPQTPSQPNEFSRLDLMKRRWKEDFAGKGLNLKPTTEVENSKRLDKEIDCTNIQKKIDEHVHHIHVDNDKDHANINTTPCSHNTLKRRKTENDQQKITSDTFSTPCCTQNGRRNIKSMRDNSKFSGAQSFMAAEKNNSSNYMLVVNHVTKESSDIQVLSRNRTSCSVYSFKQDNLDCNQPSTPENESHGPGVYAAAVIANQTQTKTLRRMKRKQDQLVRSREENAKMVELMIECIASKLTCLSINTMLKISDVEPQNALVPFMGGGVMIPYIGPFETMKKKKPRAKVDLDDESQRAWNLLMGKESNSDEGTNVDKEKWWEEERRVFHGRADSFIARMHLIQGDRRFSQWKGSVVDSVIGVFLTQNVSDHLSSSAFMSLAAKFSFKSKSSNTPTFTETNCYDQNLPSVYESDQPDNSEKQNNNESSFSKGGSGHESPDSVLSLTITSCVAAIEDGENKIPSMEDVVSSQNSTTPSINKHTSFTELLRMANDKALHATNITGNKSMFPREYGDEIDWLGLLRVNDSQTMLNEGNKYSIPPSSSDSNKTTGYSKDSNVLTSDIMVQQLPSSGSETKCFQSQSNSTIPASLDTHSQACSSSQKETDLKNTAKSYKNGDSSREVKSKPEKAGEYDWDSLRREVFENGFSKARSCYDMDSLDYEALRNAPVSEIADAIRERGMNNKLAERIKKFLDRLVRDHGSVDLEWLRHVSADKAKDYLLSIKGLGLKSVECVRLLTLHQLAFPVDTNVARISVRLGWVPLQPLPESVQIHLLEMYPVMETIQKYLWPRLCKLDQQKLYELHYQLITFGKVFCTKSKPNCNSCPMRGECKHFASAYASARLALPAPDEKRIVTTEQRNAPVADALPLPQLIEPADTQENNTSNRRNYEPIIEEPSSPEPESIETTIIDIEDAFYNDPDEIPTIQLNLEEFTQNLQKYMHENNMQLKESILSNALVAVSPDAAKIPAPKLKNVNRLRTEHQVYELPDGHQLLERMDKREPDDPSPYLLAIWTAGETAQSTEAPKSCCNSQGTDKLCDMVTCFGCNSIREAQSQTVRGTILIPCRTANRGSFPLNGTYFQVNEVFADHDSSRAPIDVPRKLIWNLNRRTVYFGTSIPSIFKGLTTEGIQHCFWRGFVCVRGFDQTTRAPRPLFARLHFPVSKLTKTKKTSTATKATTKEKFAKPETAVRSAEAEKTREAVSVEIAEENTSVQESFQCNSNGSISPQINLNDLPLD